MYSFNGRIVEILWNESIIYRSISAFCSYPSSRERPVTIPPDINDVNSRVRCGSAPLQIKNFRETDEALETA